MIKVLITGANSFVGINVEKWLSGNEGDFYVETVDTQSGEWETKDFSGFDVVFHVAGIAHVDPKPEMAPIYYSVNRDLTFEIAKKAREQGVGQFIFMSSKIVYHASKSLAGDVVSKDSKPDPNDFYGDSKLQAENKLKELECDHFNICILRPPMIYGPGNKGNLPRLGWLATKLPVFPAWHNKRSMIHINNLAEFVRIIILRHMSGTFYPQNKEFADTVELVRIFAKEHGHRIFISRIFNPFVRIGALFLPQIPKMFSDSYYEQDMSMYDFDYNVIEFKDSLKELDIHKNMK